MLLLSACSFINVNGQDRQKLDSLWTVFKQAKHDTTRIKTFLHIGDVYEYLIQDTALFYYQKAVDLSNKALKLTSSHAKTYDRIFSLKSNSLNYIGIFHSNQGSYDKAIKYYMLSLKIDEELGNKKGISQSYINIGVVHSNQGSYDKAIKYYLQSLKIFEEIGDKKGMPTCLMNIGIAYSDNGNYNKAIEYYLQSLKILEELGDKMGMSECYTNIGLVYSNQGSYNKAIKYYMQSLKNFEELGDKRGTSQCYTNIGIIYSRRGSYDKAIEYYLQSLKIDEELGDKNGMSKCYNNIGIVYNKQSSYNKAIEYYLQSLKICKELKDKKGMSRCYTNIGVVYGNQGNYDKAIEYYLQSLKIKEKLGDKKGMSVFYTNIGIIHYYQGNYDKAIKYYLKSLKIKKELGDKKGIAMVYGNISSLHITLADSAGLGKHVRAAHLDSAMQYGNKAMKIAKEIESAAQVYWAASHLQKAYKAKGNYKKALEFAEIFIETKDTIFSEEKTKALAEMGAKYKAEKKQLQIEKMEKQKQLDDKTIEAQQAENRKQQVIIFSAIGGFLIVLVFSIIILRMFRQKRKANILLAHQNEEIKQQKEEIETQRDEITEQRDKVQDQKEQIEQLYDVAIERKNIVEAQKQEIEDSILYAKRIQNAVLPADKYADSILGEHFIVFRPKDVVSGDFYWATKTEEWTVITVADCTGHGVPGAFMSMLGISFLNEIVRKKDVTNVGEVLNHLRISVIDALKQTGESGSQKDGMDMSIVAIHKTRKRMVFAGANNPLWIIRQGAQSQSFEDKSDMVQAIKADSMPVAVYLRMDDFTNHEIELNKGDQLYMFSDGFPDQFGGSKGKKFMYKKFKRLIAETSALTMKQQGKTIEKELDKWMNGNVEKYNQIDDITVVGLKI